MATLAPVTTDGDVRRSVSTWRQPLPPTQSAQRAAVLDHIIGRIFAFGSRRVRVGVDGRTAAGKTTLGDELAERMADTGRLALRASLDDFKRPWHERHLYDRLSGEGYYRNAFDTQAARRLLLDPAAPTGSGQVALCSIDPLTQVDHSLTVDDMRVDGVLIVDGVFACRPEFNPCWDLRVWVHVDPELSVCRGIARDAERVSGSRQAEALHRERYQAAEIIYIAEQNPVALADVVVDNSDFEHPQLGGQPPV